MLKRMKQKMRYLSFTTALFLLATPQWSLAQTAYVPDVETIDLGNALILEINPEKYETYFDSSYCDELHKNTFEWVTIPAVTENRNETLIVQDAYTDVKVSPPVYNADGSMETAAKADLIEIAAVTKQVTRRVIITPARQVKRLIPNLCHHDIARRLVTPKSFTIKDKFGVILNQFETPEALADYLNSK